MIKLLNIFWFLYVFINATFPVGGASLLKSLMFLVVIFFSAIFLIFRGTKFNLLTLCFIIAPYFILVLYFLKTLVLSRSDGGALFEFISISSMFFAVQLAWVLYKDNVLDAVTVIRGLILGLFSYSILKLVVTLLIFYGVIPLIYISYLSPDMTSLGNIGIHGFHRFASVNDFLFPFVFFFINRAKLPFFTTKIIQLLFIITILFSFTRSIWIIFGVLFFVRNIKSYKFIISSSLIFLIFIGSLFFIEKYTEFAIITSVENRLFVEGKGSTSEKFVQYNILKNELNNHVLSGKGLGTYVETYVRNDRLKYGYEVSWLVYAMQFGIPTLFFFILYLLYPYRTILSQGLINNDKAFSLFSLLLFLMIGFTNPIILGSLAAILYLFLFLCGDYEENN